jgi:hypothetical protein
MSRMTFPRVLFVLILAAVLSLSPRPSWAATRPVSRPQPVHTQSVSLLGQAVRHLVNLFGRVGSAIDPNGNALSVNRTPVAPIQPNGN